MLPRDQSHSRNPEPAGPQRENNRRRRGRTAGAKLTSTDGFTKIASLPHRKLILFLVVVFSDPNGTLQTMYAAIAARYGNVENYHWAKGKTRQELTVFCARYIGAGAWRLVPWEKIEDAARATLPEETATWVLAYAAGLYNEVHPGRPREDGYTGKSVLPCWAEGDAPVEFATIADWLASREPRLILPSTVIPATTKRGPSGASPADDLSEVTVPAQPHRNDLDAAEVVAKLECIERELDETRAELEVRRAADIVTQEKLRLSQDRQRLSDDLIASLTRIIHTPLDGVPTAEVKRRYEEAQGVLRQEIASLAEAGDRDCDLPSPAVDIVRSEQDDAADAPVIGVGE